MLFVICQLCIHHYEMGSVGRSQVINQVFGPNTNKLFASLPGGNVGFLF